MRTTISFPSASVEYYFESSFYDLWNVYSKENVVIVTNEYLAQTYESLFRDFPVLTVPPCETSKDLHTISNLAKGLLEHQAGRNTLLLGVGGGVVTDITGFLASMYMRGVRFGFVPTSLLGMVDAAIGGKNGVNMGRYKNILGTINQPEFILFDKSFLDTLPDDEWSNGFAEIIKYACIFDAPLFEELKQHNLAYYRDEDDTALQKLVSRCVAWKNKTVQEDEHEKGMRKLLNFGHTAAHAIENLYELPHGKAVGIGMVIACRISAEIAGLDKDVAGILEELLVKYHLPFTLKMDTDKVMELLKMDKKRVNGAIDYIVLEQIGKAAVRPLAIDEIEKALRRYEGNH